VALRVVRARVELSERRPLRRGEARVGLAILAEEGFGVEPTSPRVVQHSVGHAVLASQAALTALAIAASLAAEM
jgi:hypothetical protein